MMDKNQDEKVIVVDKEMFERLVYLVDSRSLPDEEGHIAITAHEKHELAIIEKHARRFNPHYAREHNEIKQDVRKSVNKYMRALTQMLNLRGKRVFYEDHHRHYHPVTIMGRDQENGFYLRVKDDQGLEFSCSPHELKISLPADTLVMDTGVDDPYIHARH